MTIYALGQHTPQIHPDTVLRRNSREATGNFYIDDEVLREEGVTDLEAYSVEPGADLLPDFFL